MFSPKCFLHSLLSDWPSLAVRVSVFPDERREKVQLHPVKCLGAVRVLFCFLSPIQSLDGAIQFRLVGFWFGLPASVSPFFTNSLLLHPAQCHEGPPQNKQIGPLNSEVTQLSLFMVPLQKMNLW